jgi:hypothetical protein
VEHLTNSVPEPSEMIHPLKPTLAALLQTEYALKVGDWVEVLCEYAPGTCSDGGVGSIVKIERDGDERAWCTVAYVLDKRVESGIDQNRITVTIMPYKDLTSKKRQGRDRQETVVEETETRKYEPPDRTPIEWLQWGLKSRTHEKRGWLKDKLLKAGLLEPTNEALWKRIISDYKCQMSALEGMKLAMGAKFEDPREYKGVPGEAGKFVSLKKDSQQDVPKNMWTIPFLIYAYDVKRSNFQNKRRADKKGATTLTDGIKKRTQFNKGDCVITNRAASRCYYSARYFFSRMKALSGTLPQFMDDTRNYPYTEDVVYRRPEWSFYTQRVAYWNAVYDSILAEQCCLVINDDIKEYERMAREHDEKQPFIQEQDRSDQSVQLRDLQATCRAHK